MARVSTPWAKGRHHQPKRHVKRLSHAASAIGGAWQTRINLFSMTLTPDTRRPQNLAARMAPVAAPTQHLHWNQCRHLASNNDAANP
jgi:hypothetical protein